VDVVGQSTEALWWPLRYADLYVASHCRSEEALCHIFIGTNPPEKLLQSFHIDVRVDRLASGLSARCIVAGITAADWRPERGRSDTLPCPCSDDASRFAQRLTVLLSTAMLQRRLLSPCEYFWLIRFLPEETQLLISV
jgi:hypothetical protein